MSNDRCTPKIIIRNDDVAYDTDISNLEWFCETVDSFGLKVMQAITPIGKVKFIDSHHTNDYILANCGGYWVGDNSDLIDCLLARGDLIAVHGLRHVHYPTMANTYQAIGMLSALGFEPTWFVPPFNEWDPCNGEFCGLKVSAKTQRLEDFLPGKPLWGTKPKDKILYLHSWRFGTWYQKDDLPRALLAICSSLTSVAESESTRAI